MISIVTAARNCSSTIGSCLDSVSSQTYKDVEHIVVDGASTDGTLRILRQHKSKPFVLSEPDSGIYEALNKGFSIASGSIIGVLHADDSYTDQYSLERVYEAFLRSKPDYIYGDVRMKRADGHVVRYWKAGLLTEGRIFCSQIPHPTIFLSRNLVRQLNPPFDQTYRIAADLKQQLVFANLLGARGLYLPMPIVDVRLGGLSTSSPRAYFNGWVESRRAWNEVHGSGGAMYVLRKLLHKLPGLL
jgi:glycosyltransferase involved in cell wall biosynthesis